MAVDLVVFVSFRTNEVGYPFETSTDNKCFFSPEITDGFVVRCLARSYRHLTIPRFTDCTLSQMFFDETMVSLISFCRP